MNTVFWIGIYLITFVVMEFMAWFSHKYIMHGFLWSLHKDHHKKDHGSWFERNDFFFTFYAAISILLMVLWGEYGFWAGFPMAAGIFTYGVAYFLVHDIFIHQRFKIFRNTNNRYAKAYEERIKFITKTSTKKEGNVLACCGFLENTSVNLLFLASRF